VCRQQETPFISNSIDSLWHYFSRTEQKHQELSALKSLSFFCPCPNPLLTTVLCSLLCLTYRLLLNNTNYQAISTFSCTTAVSSSEAIHFQVSNQHACLIHLFTFRDYLLTTNSQIKPTTHKHPPPRPILAIQHDE
jgi:hypothetical protein